MEKKVKKKIKLFTSLQKERLWLESMAKKGWFLSNMTLGIFYTFEKGEPKNMMYEVDRFNLPKKPSLEEIRHKEFFMDMAEELGWKEVTHDESLTYYFCKEYKEDDINELYNDEESRRIRGKKFTSFYYKKAQEIVFWATLMIATYIFVMLLCNVLPELEKLLEVYNYFTLAYVVTCNTIALVYWKLGRKTEEELSMSREEWQKRQDSTRYKKVKKWIFTIRGLNRFLRVQEEQGWILTDASALKYYLEKKEEKHQIYTMDSKWLTNKRRRERQQQVFKDNKDWEGMNNDWQIQSLKDAEEKGWQFVCALENRAVIYRGDAETVEPLNEAKYDNSLRGISLIGTYGLFLLISGLAGGVIGFVSGMLGL